MNECKYCGRSCLGSLCEVCRCDARLDEDPLEESDLYLDEFDDYDNRDPADDEYTWSDE